jgi:tripartite-type tricarboxylate transporter receptor subunit TctC
MIHRRELGLAALGTLALAGTSARAQDLPRGSITVIVPWAPGGSADALSRLLASQLSGSVGQSFVVENRAGASGLVGHAAVARARPDGSTLLFAACPTFVMVPHLLPVPYDGVRAFAPIGTIMSSPLLFCASPALGVRDIQGLVAKGKAQPGTMSYGSAGTGSSTHLATELLLSMSGAPITDVSYRGNAPAVQAVLTGEVAFTCVDALVALPFVRSGDLVPLAVSTRWRSPVLPEVPTVAESGYPEYECATDFALLAPAGTPAPTIARLHAAVKAALETPEMRDKLAQQSVVPAVGEPGAFPAYVERESAKWGELIRARGIKLQQ